MAPRAHTLSLLLALVSACSAAPKPADTQASTGSTSSVDSSGSTPPQPTTGTSSGAATSTSTTTTTTTTSTTSTGTTLSPGTASTTGDDSPWWYLDVSRTLPGPSLTGQTMEARAADLDGDGDLDLVLAKEWQPNALLLNDGTGHFIDASGRIPQAVHDHEDIAIADFDADGDLDVVVASEDDMAKEFYLNDGEAMFTDVSDRLPQLGTSNAVAAADIDGDGDLDLVFGCDGGERVLINDGKGEFADESALRIAQTTDVTQDVAFADIDGDGDLDLALGNEDGNKLLVNDGKGVFTDVTAAQLPGPAAPEETRNADLGDVDGDGDPDLYFSNVAFQPTKQAQDRLLINDGTGTFTDESMPRIPAEMWWTMDTDIVDVDADGDRDLVQAILPAGRRYRLLLNDGAGSFTDQTEALMPPTAIGGGVEVEAGDYDGDGDLDLYLTGFDSPDRLLLKK